MWTSDGGGDTISLSLTEVPFHSPPSVLASRHLMFTHFHFEIWLAGAWSGLSINHHPQIRLSGRKVPCGSLDM